MPHAYRVNNSRADAINSRIEHLERLTSLITESISIPATDVVLNVTRPTSLDALLDDVVDDPEDNLPYWAEIWPSGIALASEILNNPHLVAGKPAFELGCGVGVTAVAALMAGAELTISDYSVHSLRLAKINCLQADVNLPPARQLNWRDAQADLLQSSGERWPVVLAADVLYEERDIEPVLAVLESILAPDGLVLLAEPGRRVSKLAMERAQERGWEISTNQYSGPWTDPKDKDVIVSVHSMKR